jgi:hypothetical protein
MKASLTVLWPMSQRVGPLQPFVTTVHRAIGTVRPARPARRTRGAGPSFEERWSGGASVLREGNPARRSSEESTGPFRRASRGPCCKSGVDKYLQIRRRPRVCWIGAVGASYVTVSKVPIAFLECPAVVVDLQHFRHQLNQIAPALVVALTNPTHAFSRRAAMVCPPRVVSALFASAVVIQECRQLYCYAERGSSPAFRHEQ